LSGAFNVEPFNKTSEGIGWSVVEPKTLNL
jgi:hypothetical protein